LRQANPQVDALHVAMPFAGAEQDVEQAPQLPGSLRVSTHEPLQLIEPAAQLSVHLPCEHVSIAPHFSPHAPQFATTAARLTHAPPHPVYPESHAMPHWPLTQAGAPCAGNAHLVSHLPQCFTSLSSLRHWPEHAEYPGSQAIAHLLLSQIAPPLTGTAQAVLQAPQCATLALRSTQADEHAVVPDGQTLTQWPPEHASVFVHAIPQPPQSFGSVRGSTQEASQRAKPAWQVNEHQLAMQTGTPNAGTSQMRPHAAQFFGSLALSTHWSPQSVRPASQLDRHELFTHVAVPLGGLGQAWSQAPQCTLLLANSAQAEPQATSELGHALAQAPLAQTWPIAQTAPQAPQLAESACRSTQPALHAVKPSLQTLAHVPARHVEWALDAGLHACPQAPQLALSPTRSTHLGPQRSSAASHTKLQRPPTQTDVAEPGAVHSTEQPPQCCEFLPVSTHSSPHTTCSQATAAGGAGLAATGTGSLLRPASLRPSAGADATTAATSPASTGARAPSSGTTTPASRPRGAVKMQISSPLQV
jgi:hypothetical protein